MAAKEFEVLYTHQKTKKAKVWQDGTLKVLADRTKSILLDEKKTQLDTVFVKSSDVIPGEQLETDRYLIQVEQEKQNTQTPVTTSLQETHKRPSSDRCVVAGLKRKKKGFIPPRVVKAPSPEKSDFQISCFSPRPTPVSEMSTPKITPVPCQNIMNMYSDKTKTSPQYVHSEKIHDDASISSQLSGFMTNLRSQQMLQKSPDQMQMPWKMFGSPSNSSLSSFKEDLNENKILFTNKAVSENPNKDSASLINCDLNEQDYLQTGPCPTDASYSYSYNSMSKQSLSCSKIISLDSGTKRSTSQILALLKDKECVNQGNVCFSKQGESSAQFTDSASNDDACFHRDQISDSVSKLFRAGNSDFTDSSISPDSSFDGNCSKSKSDNYNINNGENDFQMKERCQKGKDSTTEHEQDCDTGNKQLMGQQVSDLTQFCLSEEPVAKVQQVNVDSHLKTDNVIVSEDKQDITKPLISSKSSPTMDEENYAPMDTDQVKLDTEMFKADRSDLEHEQTEDLDFRTNSELNKVLQNNCHHNENNCVYNDSESKQNNIVQDDSKHEIILDNSARNKTIERDSNSEYTQNIQDDFDVNSLIQEGTNIKQSATLSVSEDNEFIQETSDSKKTELPPEQNNSVICNPNSDLNFEISFSPLSCCSSSVEDESVEDTNHCPQLSDTSRLTAPSSYVVPSVKCSVHSQPVEDTSPGKCDENSLDVQTDNIPDNQKLKVIDRKDVEMISSNICENPADQCESDKLSFQQMLDDDMDICEQGSLERDKCSTTLCSKELPDNFSKYNTEREPVESHSLITSNCENSLVSERIAENSFQPTLGDLKFSPESTVSPSKSQFSENFPKSQFSKENFPKSQFFEEDFPKSQVSKENVTKSLLNLYDYKTSVCSAEKSSQRKVDGFVLTDSVKEPKNKFDFKSDIHEDFSDESKSKYQEVQFGKCNIGNVKALQSDTMYQYQIQTPENISGFHNIQERQFGISNQDHFQDLPSDCDWSIQEKQPVLHSEKNNSNLLPFSHGCQFQNKIIPFNDSCHSGLEEQQTRNFDAETLFINQSDLELEKEKSSENHNAESLFMTTFKHSQKSSQIDIKPDLHEYSSESSLLFDKVSPQVIINLPHPSELFNEDNKTNISTNMIDGVFNKLAEYKMKGSKSARASRQPNSATFVHMRREKKPSLSDFHCSSLPNTTKFKTSRNTFQTSPLISDTSSPSTDMFSQQSKEQFLFSVNDQSLDTSQLAGFKCNSVSDVFDKVDVTADNIQNQMASANHPGCSGKSLNLQESDISIFPEHLQQRDVNPEIVTQEESLYIDWNEGKPTSVDNAFNNKIEQVQGVPHTELDVSAPEQSPKTCQQVPVNRGVLLSNNMPLNRHLVVRAHRLKKPLKTLPFDDVTHTPVSTEETKSEYYDDKICLKNENKQLTDIFNTRNIPNSLSFESEKQIDVPEHWIKMFGQHDSNSQVSDSYNLLSNQKSNEAVKIKNDNLCFPCYKEVNHSDVFTVKNEENIHTHSKLIRNDDNNHEDIYRRAWKPEETFESLELDLCQDICLERKSKWDQYLHQEEEEGIEFQFYSNPQNTDIASNRKCFERTITNPLNLNHEQYSSNIKCEKKSFTEFESVEDTLKRQQSVIENNCEHQKVDNSSVCSSPVIELSDLDELSQIDSNYNNTVIKCYNEKEINNNAAFKITKIGDFDKNKFQVPNMICSVQSEEMKHETQTNSDMHFSAVDCGNNLNRMSPILFDDSQLSVSQNTKLSVSASKSLQLGPQRVNRKFQNPLLSSSSAKSVLKHSQRNLCGDLQFPSKSEVENEVSPLRQVVIPVSFPSVNSYKHVLTAALKEYINVMLFDLSKSFHSALQRADLAGYSSSNSDRRNCLAETSHANTNPPCQCGVPAKMVQVKKDGVNKGRFFYACNAPRNQQCKFFQWADQMKKSKQGISVSSGVRLNDADSITAFFRGHDIVFFCECQFVRKHPARSSFSRGFPAWARHSEISDKKLMYIKLSSKRSSSVFSKDDLWIVSQNLTFEPGTTFLAKSMYFGPNSANELEIEPISGFSPSNWTNECVCHAVLAGNASNELNCMVNIQDYIQPTSLPILKHLLHRDTERCNKNKEFNVPAIKYSSAKLHVPGHLVVEIASNYVNRYKLNCDQAEALMKTAAMINVEEKESDSVVLIQGVFGAGKSFLLSIIIRFLVEIFEMNDHQVDNEMFSWKLLISSTTNVAVDRVLLGLLELGYEDFVRVGSLKKIAKPVLPYSVHASGTDSQELKDLQEMFRSDLTASERHYVRKSIEKHRLGENKKKLGHIHVVGVTCAAANFQCLAKMTFPFVVLDECSQMTEPSSLLPIARFGCEKLVLVGDPKQLDPTIQGSEAAHNQGLEQTMFDRLMKMGYPPVVLRTQYRCHPLISAISNHLFYDSQLKDGITEQDRQPLSQTFPTLCFYDVGCGKECDEGSGSYYNDSEAQFVVLIIDTLIAEGVDPSVIGVITLYKAQVFKINALLYSSRSASHKAVKGIQVSTVDAFQGGERDVIILSCVRSNSLGFIDCNKRMNVALTRARHHLLVVGNLKNLSKNNLWSQMLQHCEELPDGIQRSDRVEKKLRVIIKEHISSQESASGSNITKKKQQTGKRKRKTTKENESPPMSLSDDESQTSAHGDEESWSETKLASPSKDKVRQKEKLPQIKHKTALKRQKFSEMLQPIAPDSSDTDDDLPSFAVISKIL